MVNNSEIIKFDGDNSVDIFKNISDWLYKNGYNFKSDSSNSRSVYTRAQIIENNYPISRFHKIQGSNLYIPTTMTGNISVRVKNIILMLKNFGIDEKSIKTEGLPVIIPTPKIKRFGQIEISDDIQDVVDEDEIEDIKNIKIFSKNPFRQAICVLGGSGAGKSTTIENILESEGHEFEFIIPSASTTGLLSQFSPSKNSYIQSRLGKMIMNAYEDPTQLYTAVIDEFHKSNIIEMVNDEIMHAISTKRFGGKRFISLDTDTEELYPTTTKWRGNMLIPDNFGFIFISSKPKVISNNPDFFNRLDVVVLKHHEEERIQTSRELLGKVLSEDEKMKLASTRSDD